MKRKIRLILGRVFMAPVCMVFTRLPIEVVSFGASDAGTTSRAG